MGDLNFFNDVRLVRFIYLVIKKNHYKPGQALRFQEFEAPKFQENPHMKLLGLSAQSTGRFYPAGNIPGVHFC